MSTVPARIILCLAILQLTTVARLGAQDGPMPEQPVIKAVLLRMQSFRESERKRDSALKHPLGSFTPADFRRQYQFYDSCDKVLANLDCSTCSATDKVNLELLRYSMEDDLAEYRFSWYLVPFLSDNGFHTNLAFRANGNFRTRKEFQDYLDMLADIPRYMDEHFALMREGIRLGITQPKDMFKGYDQTWEQHIVSDPRKSVFWKPFNARPSSIDSISWSGLQAEAEAQINTNVVPSFIRVREFFTKEYIPKARTQAGIVALPNANALYRERVKHFTTTQMTPEEVYQVGEKEVARITAAMNQVMQEVGFKGTLQEFITSLRSDKRFFADTPEDLLKEASYIAKKADGKLPLLFGKLPRQPYGVEPVPADLAPVYTGGRYSGAPINSRRAGNYWVNTYNLPSRTLYTLEALTLHEAMPGHHLQIALAQELENLPRFRRNLYVNAFGEGWGLYSEFLGYEMGFYKDPYSRFGQLTYDMWRACRLVIDVGLHYKGWTREQAVEYLASRTALSLHEVNTEILRYMAWPGQALAYKTGELQIKKLRKRAEEALGEKFDVRAFHDKILSEGTVTLSIMENMVEEFIGEVKSKK
jgi:uncharacterized protein (DUF885 family)